MANFALIFVCLGGGFLLSRLRATPKGMARGLSHYVVYVALPAVTAAAIHELSAFSLFPVLMPWLTLLVCLILVLLLGPRLGWSRATMGAVILCAGFGNTSFVGFPFIEALYGAAGLKVAVLADQPGSFLALSTVGLVVIAVASGRAVSATAIVRKMVTFPPFIALLLALALRPVGFPEVVKEVLEKLGATLVPVALVSVGLQLQPRLSQVRRRAVALIYGLVYKLVVAPLLIWLLYVVLLHAQGLETRVSVVEAAMAPMVTGAILASEYGLDPELASLLVGVGIPLSLATGLFWAWLVRAV